MFKALLNLLLFATGYGFVIRMKLTTLQEDMDKLDLRIPMEIKSTSCEGIVEQIRRVAPFDEFFNQLHIIPPSNEMICLPYVHDQDVYEKCMVLVQLQDQVHVLIQQNMSNQEICKLVTIPSPEQIPDQCKTCRYVTHFISECVHVGNQTLEVIEAAARIACAAEVGQRVSPSCDVIINHFNDLIHWIGQGLTPSDCCKKLNLCTIPETKVESMHTVLADACVFCTEATGMIEDAIKKDNSTIETVRHGLELLCHHISAESKCHEYLKHFDEVAKWLQDGKDPREICQSLGLCSTKAVVSTSDKPNDPPCTACHALGVTIEILSSVHNETIGEIRDEFDTICAAIPADMNINCTEWLTNFDDLVRTIQSGTSPFEACKQLGLCTDLSILFNHVMVTRFSELNCSGCQVFGMLLHALHRMGNGYTIQLRSEFDHFCHQYPLESKVNCTKMLSTYDTMASLIANGASPNDVCDRMDCCMDVVSEPAHTENGDPGCTACNILGTAIEVLSSFQNDSIAQIRDELDTVCSAIPPELNVNCTSWLSKFDTLVKLIQEGQSPQDACKQIGLCSEFQTIQIQLLHFQNNLSCVLCTTTASAIEATTKYDDSKLPLIKQGLGVVCTFLPGDSRCDELVSKFEDMTKFIENGEDPKEVCTSKLHMCSATVPQLRHHVMAIE